MRPSRCWSRANVPIPKKEFRLRFDGAPFPFEILEPEEVQKANSAGDVFQLLEAAERALARGLAIGGFFSYEFGYACAGVPRPAREPSPPPLAVLAFFDPRRMRPVTDIHAPRDGIVVTPFSATVEPGVYAEHISAIQAQIIDGEVYQVNYTVPFMFAFDGDPYAAYLRLLARSRAPQAAYVASDDFAAASLSPELFLEFFPGGLRTRPMKGTAPPDAAERLADAKNRAEHLMIVDLLRNDLGRVCDEVRVERLFTTEHYPTFATTTSTIAGSRRTNAHLTDVFAALFPCGSVTGAPKIAAMRAIATHESTDRGVYCGTVGYLMPDGHGRFNVAIRTLQFDRAAKRGRLDLGGGIVADSQAAAEWAEIRVKGRLFEELAPFEAA